MDSRDEFLRNFKIVCNKYSDSVSILYAYNHQDTFGITLSQLNELSNDLSKYLKLNCGVGPQYVGVELSDYLFLPSLILAIWKTGYFFAGVSDQYTVEDNVNYLNFLKVKYIITDSSRNIYNGEIMSTFYLHDQKFFLLRRGIETENNEKSPNFACDMCYGIMTSGTTGQTKIIQVPWSCILPNAKELSLKFQINNSDCLFLASPYTFDPFFIELFLFLLNGCTLLIVPNYIKLCSSALLRILFSTDSSNNEVPVIARNLECFENYFFNKLTKVKRKPITFMQITPSFFKRWNDTEIKESILSSKTSLKTLVLGGESFPEEVLSLREPSNKTKIFNIYGITEISCWAFLNDEIALNFTDTKVSLGKKLNNINFTISKDGELIIGSKSRICLINEEKITELNEKNVVRKTGDIVELINDKLYFLSRKNQIVKKYGIKICIRNIEEAFLKVNKLFRSVSCVYDEMSMKIGLFFLLHESSTEMEYKQVTYEEFINKDYHIPKDLIKDIEIPDYFIKISQLPVNLHGKCDKAKMLQILRDINNLQRNTLSLKTEVLNMFNEVLGCKKSVNLKKSFTELGGTSVMALQIIGKLEKTGFKVPKNFIMNLLDKKSLSFCIEILKEQLIESEVPFKKIKLNNLGSNLILSVKWKFDLGKCIDATPTVFTHLGKRKVLVGSHSSKLSCVDSDNGSSLWTILLGDRIESGFTVSKDKSRGFIGCYDGFVYCLSVADGKLFWKYKTQDMVKSTPCLSSDDKVVFVSSYDGCLYCLSYDNGDLLKKIQISQKGIFSSGVASSVLKTFFIATLDGTCLGLHEKSFEEIWKKKLDSPVFASPCLLSNNLIVIAEVLGVVHCFNTIDDSTVWKYVSNGLIYSSPISYLINDIELIIFGCYDHHIYCLENGESVKLKWKEGLGGTIFGRLSIFCLNSSSVITCAAATTDGFIYLCDFINGEVQAKIKLDGEIFSSPVYAQNEIFVGCRDNNVYCIKIMTSYDSE